MIRFVRTIGQDGFRLCSLLRFNFNTQQTNNAGGVFSGKNVSLNNHLCSLQSPTIVQEDVQHVSQIIISPQMISILETAKAFGFQEDDIKQLFHNQPDLIKTSANLWNSVVGTLLDNGFQKEEILLILEKWPKVLTLTKNVLVQNLQAWLKCGFEDFIMFEVLTTHPSFLDVNRSHIIKRVKQYQLYFESKRRVGKLLILAPNTLEESWKVLCDKLNYLDELCTEKSTIASTGVLAHSPFHIKARHEFLIRSGLYKRPQKDFNRKLSKNPHLDRIVNTTDDSFVTNVARLSMFEYSIFLEMFEEELAENEICHEDDSDSDDETHRLNYGKNRRRKK